MEEVLRQLAIDINRLEYYSSKNNEDKIEEYKNLVIYHVKDLLNKREIDWN